MSKKARPTDEDCFVLSAKPNKIQNKSTKKTNVHHGFTEKSRKMVTIMFILVIQNMFYCLTQFLSYDPYTYWLLLLCDSVSRLQLIKYNIVQVPILILLYPAHDRAQAQMLFAIWKREAEDLLLIILKRLKKIS